eukprot:CAMPEP_0198132098 /NCGR_PEP_ID=MMETSP1442-20131203/57591_1 /TAXON_ID= /ORGANISM="Craspedostauros australis, Strain CCMP3328" /LENGTH=99 /DNA_ID=CAMNT_0043793033 /DNA_START=884 /DNA_END=1180 /DNA_ORIENTATION=+
MNRHPLSRFQARSSTVARGIHAGHHEPGSSGTMIGTSVLSTSPTDALRCDAILVLLHSTVAIIAPQFMFTGEWNTWDGEYNISCSTRMPALLHPIGIAV